MILLKLEVSVSKSRVWILFCANIGEVVDPVVLLNGMLDLGVQIFVELLLTDQLEDNIDQEQQDVGQSYHDSIHDVLGVLVLGLIIELELFLYLLEKDPVQVVALTRLDF